MLPAQHLRAHQQKGASLLLHTLVQQVHTMALQPHTQDHQQRHQQHRSRTAVAPNHHHHHHQQQQQQPRMLVVAAAAAARKRNPILDVERDVLPDGKPNTPWRRLKLKIQVTVSIQGLIYTYNSNRHKTAVWRPIHSAGIFMRLAALNYYRLLPQQQQADEQTSQLSLQLLDLMAPDLAHKQVTRVIDGERLAQLIVVLSLINPGPPPHLLDPLLREVMRNRGNKLPKNTPGLLVELACALVRLGCQEQQLWLAVAAAAMHSLQLQAYSRQQQQQPPQQQQQQQGSAVHGVDRYTAPFWAAVEAAGDDGLLPPPNFDDTAATAAAAVVGGTYATMQQQQQLLPWHLPPLQTPRRPAAVWLSGDYPKFASAIAAVGLEDRPLLQLLGSEAVAVLPLLSLTELAQLAEAYAALAEPHPQLIAALWQQLPQTAARASYPGSSSGGSSGGSNRQHAVAVAAGVIGVMHPLVTQLMSDNDVTNNTMTKSNKQHNRVAQQMQQMLRAVQDLLIQSGNSSSSGSNGGLLSAVRLVQLLELLAAAGSSTVRWRGGPLAKWTCTAVAAAGLESLLPHQLQAAAAALAGLQLPPRTADATAATSAATALAAAAAAREADCGPCVLVGVLWGCVSVGCYDMLLAEVTVGLVRQTAAPGQPSSGFTLFAPRNVTPLKQQQQAAGLGGSLLGPQQQAQLVWSLQQMGRADLVQQVMAVCLAPGELM